MPSPVPIISELRAFNIPRSLESGIELSYDENNVTIGFLGFWYQNPSGLGFEYKLDGYDLDWIYSKDRRATYSSLPPGDYSFHVRVSESEDFSRAKDVSVGFVVRPPIWRTTAFYFFASFVLALTGYGYIRWRERRLMKTKVELEQRVSERTSEIQRKNEEIQHQAREIRAINESLERRVHERTHELRRKNKALEEYAFINAHNLRSPVASILGLIDLLDREAMGPDGRELVGHMKQSAERLDGVVRSITESIEKGDGYEGFEEKDDEGID
jgi:signal transduction histidine kinase